MIRRILRGELEARLAATAAVTLLGPRQIGKTTLARDVAEGWPSGHVYLDLERPADLRRLEDPDAFLRAQRPRLVVLDEIHRTPGLFEVLRGVIDDNRRAGFRHGQFLLLGSASLDLIRFSSESLAGRVAHLHLAGVGVDEAAQDGSNLETVWVRGGYPDSLTAPTERASLLWRQDLITAYLERDVPVFAPRIPAETLRRLWTMLAHSSGGLLNASRLAAGLGVSGPTVDRYVDLLVDLGLVRRLQPWHTNTGKRLTKSPKVFVRDTGLLHALLEIEDLHQLLGHPSVGPSFESLAIENLTQAAGAGRRPFHYRTARGDEVDLVLTKAGHPCVAIEVKRSTAPSVSAGFHRGVADLDTPHRYVVHPGDGPAYHTGGGVIVIGLTALVGHLRAEGSAS